MNEKILDTQIFGVSKFSLRLLFILNLAVENVAKYYILASQIFILFVFPLFSGQPNMVSLLFIAYFFFRKAFGKK